MTDAIRLPDIPDPDLHVMERVYQKWAPIYDALCGPIFLTGRRAAAAAARQVGGRILEIGVGTGLSFDDYDHTTEITGIDISEPMITRARERLASGKYPFVKALHVMVRKLCRSRTKASTAWWRNSSSRWSPIPNRSCPNARVRVLKPGGQIILVNHLYSERGIAAAIERATAKHARHLGLRPEFPFARLEAWSRGEGDIELIERRKLKPFGVYTLVRFRRGFPRSLAA